MMLKVNSKRSKNYPNNDSEKAIQGFTKGRIANKTVRNGMQRLHKSKDDRGGRIADNTERKGWGYTTHGVTEGEGSPSIQRWKAEAAEIKGEFADNTERKAEAIQIEW